MYPNWNAGHFQPPVSRRTTAMVEIHCIANAKNTSSANAPPGEVECLRFVLEDLGWEGYLGFIEDGVANLHIGPSPDSREFFASVFQESIGKKSDESAGQ